MSSSVGANVGYSVHVGRPSEVLSVGTNEGYSVQFVRSSVGIRVGSVIRSLSVGDIVGIVSKLVLIDVGMEDDPYVAVSSTVGDSVGSESSLGSSVLSSVDSTVGVIVFDDVGKRKISVGSNVGLYVGKRIAFPSSFVVNSSLAATRKLLELFLFVKSKGKTKIKITIISLRFERKREKCQLT